MKQKKQTSTNKIFMGSLEDLRQAVISLIQKKPEQAAIILAAWINKMSKKRLKKAA